MSKKLCAVLLVIIVFALTACGSTNASSKAVSIAKTAIEVADKYLDSKITAKEATEKLDELTAEMEYVDELTTEDKNKVADFSISSSILILSSSITIDDYKETSDTYEKVVEARNVLAKHAGLRKR